MAESGKSMGAHASRKDFRFRALVLTAAIALAPSLAGCTQTTAGTGSTASTSSTTGGAESAAGGQVQLMIDKALAQVGDQYIFGVEVSVTDPDPSAWDSAELTRWAAFQAGSVIPGSSFEQYLDLKSKGLLVPVDEGKTTPGALLFHFSAEPVPGGGRPDEASVALSLGGGRVVEAQSEEVGVVTGDAGYRFEYAALLPGTIIDGCWWGMLLDARGDTDASNRRRPTLQSAPISYWREG